ncbi:zinc finger protein 511 isoform X1 [Oncorhynchus kisutch]|uniref:zinc finger protein 511 isoform X1 n=1 Tax=Oncorhynchus kisutch TaxID=8019 RepID=UPI0012DBE453|nr:zinc finger protein 511 isoform X1 [Oncorhynchus kisutch]
MLQPELIQLLTASDLVDLRIDAIPKLQVGFRPGCFFSSSGSQDGEAKLTFIPQQILLNKDHELFEDGDIHRHLYLQNLSTCPAYDSPTARQCEFRCYISGCSQVFSTVEDYEHHYNTLHRHVCSSCQRSLPSARLLDIHIQEWHDSLFSILAERQDMVANIHAHKRTCTHTHYVAHSGLDLDQSMHTVFHSLSPRPKYQCLVEGCGSKFRTRDQRKDHMIKIHKYPSDFMFDKVKRIKNIKIAKKNMLQKGTSMEVSMSVSEPEGVCEVLSDQPEEEEYMEINHSLEPGILDPPSNPINTVELSTDHDTAPILSVTIQPTTNQQRPQHNRERHSYRVPRTVCFGQGSVQGFRGHGRRI